MYYRKIETPTAEQASEDRFAGDEVIPTPLKQQTQRFILQDSGDRLWPRLVIEICRRACWPTQEFNNQAVPWLRKLTLYRPVYYEAWSRAWKPKAEQDPLRFRQLIAGSFLPGDSHCRVVLNTPCHKFVLHSVHQPFFDRPIQANGAIQGAFVELTWGVYIREQEDGIAEAVIRARANYRPQWILEPLVEIMLAPVPIEALSADLYALMQLPK